MPNLPANTGAGGVGWIIALLVLIVAIVLFLIGEYTRDALLGLIAALALARLIP